MYGESRDELGNNEQLLLALGSVKRVEREICLWP